MINKINKLLGTKLTKEGKRQINEWLLDEFETIYYAKKQLDTDEAIIDFVNDMLADKNIKLESLCLASANKVVKKINSKSSKQNKTEYFRYCPYCGECIDFNLKEK